MMQLRCNGIRLDVYEGVRVQFTQENPLFAFDSLQCERTTQFSLPSTPTNDRVFELARIPAYNGRQMRRRIPAEMIDGTVVKNGYLYIAEYDGTDYRVVFVTGELLGLQAIKNLGKLSDVISFNEVAYYGQSPSSPAYGIGRIWETILYLKPDDERYKPSIDLACLYNAICQQAGIVAEPLPTGADGVRIIPATLKGLQEQDVMFERRVIAPMAQGSNPQVTAATMSVPELFSQALASVMYRVESGGVITAYTGRVQQLKALQTLTIKFPDDWDEDLFVGQFNDGGSYLVGEFEFYGGRAFDEDGAVSGDPLAGHSIEVPVGNYVCIISKDDYFKGMDSGGARVQGWMYHNGGALDVTMEMSGKVDVGSWVRLQDNLPDITFTDLLKLVAALSGKVLYYTESGGLTFEDLDFGTYRSKADVRFVKRGAVARTFADYAQRNIVRFDDEQADRLQAVYTIANVNIAEEKELQVLPFSEGRDYAGRLYVFADGEKDFLGIADGGASLGRVALPMCSGLVDICAKSTQFKVTLRMLLMEFESVKPKILVEVDNSRYVWTSRSWQDGAAQFTLAQIP